MPIVPHSSLPAFERLLAEGVDVGEPDPKLVDLHIGLMNLMPSAALAATDRQFTRLVSGGSHGANLHVYPFTVATELRSEEAQRYVGDYYSSFADLAEMGLDALILTGANPSQLELADEPFWPGMSEVLRWADSEVESVLCSCLATHAVLEIKGLTKRSLLPEKRWGIYEHEVLLDDHPLLAGVGAPVEAPHSHFFDISRKEMENAEVTVLVFSEEAGVHMAVSPDGFRYVFFQGHPEYDDISLLKEYKREVFRYMSGQREDYPPMPAHYFDLAARKLLAEYRSMAERVPNGDLPDFPESEVTRRWRPYWSVQGKAIYRNWLAELSTRA